MKTFVRILSNFLKTLDYFIDNYIDYSFISALFVVILYFIFWR